jgi:hypothetical protein
VSSLLSRSPILSKTIVAKQNDKGRDVYQIEDAVIGENWLPCYCRGHLVVPFGLAWQRPRQRPRPPKSCGHVCGHGRGQRGGRGQNHCRARCSCCVFGAVMWLRYCFLLSQVVLNTTITIATSTIAIITIATITIATSIRATRNIATSTVVASVMCYCYCCCSCY